MSLFIKNKSDLECSISDLFLRSSALFIFAKEFPERSRHQPLYELAGLETSVNFVTTEKDDVDVFRFLKVLG